MPDPIVLVGSPTALGGHFDGMERTPAELRRLGLVDRLRAAPGLAAATLVDAGDAPNDQGWAPDDDRHAKNRARIVTYLPRLATHVRDGLLAAGEGGAAPRLLVVGGDCTSHAGAMAGIVRARPGIRLGICWFKTGATEHIARIWEMVQILERNGIYVKKIRTDKPGYVIYEDEWQLVAEPFRKGTMPRK